MLWETGSSPVSTCLSTAPCDSVDLQLQADGEQGGCQADMAEMSCYPTVWAVSDTPAAVHLLGSWSVQEPPGSVEGFKEKPERVLENAPAGLMTSLLVSAPVVFAVQFRAYSRPPLTHTPITPPHYSNTSPQILHIFP